MFSNLTWYQKSRLKAIEILCYWHGSINTRDVINLFGVSRTIAQSDMSNYQTIAPGNIVYQKSLRTFVATSVFSPILSQCSIDEYMQLQSLDAVTPVESSITHIVKPAIKTNPEVFRMVLSSIRKNKTITIHYLSLNDPKGSEREVQPHSFVYSGFRWHMRAYCFKRQAFRDFNISRVTSISIGTTYSPEVASSIKDDSWNNLIVVQFIANPALIESERRLIESEFGLTKGVLNIEIRECHLEYTLQNYQVNINDKTSVRKNRLLCSNEEELKQYFWPSK